MNYQKLKKIHYFLESIPKEYDQLVSYYEFMDDDIFVNLSFCEMKNKFYNAEIKLKNTCPAEKSEAFAFVARRNNGKRVKCYSCGVYGHKSFECPNKTTHMPNKRQKFNCEKPQREQSMIAMERRIPCVLDSGATSHMVNDERLFDSIEVMKNPSEISLAKKGGTSVAVKKGIVKAKSCVDSNEIYDIVFYNVLFVPDIQASQ